MVKVEGEEEAGAQLWLRGGKDSTQLVEPGRHVAHVDLGVILILLKGQGGALQYHKGGLLGLQGLFEVPVGLGEGLLRPGQHIPGESGLIVDFHRVHVTVGVGAAQIEVVQAVPGFGQIGAPDGAVVHTDGTESQGEDTNEKGCQDQKEQGEDGLPPFGSSQKGPLRFVCHVRI